MYTSLEQFKQEKDKEFIKFQQYIDGEPYDSFNSIVRPSDVRRFLSQAIDEAGRATVEVVYEGGNTIYTTLDNLKSTDG